MNHVGRVIFAATLFVSSLSYSQQLVKREYLVRVETTTFDTFSGTNNFCVVVWPDGRYRLERTRQDISGGKPDTRVFLDALPDGSLKQLQAILGDGQFKEIHRKHEEASAIVRDLEPLQVTVPRENELQTFYFVNAEDRKPFEKGLKPFTNWLKELQKRKVKESKQEKPNRCATPMVQYRYTTTPPQMQQDEQ